MKKKMSIKVKSLLLYNLFFMIIAIGFNYLIPVMLNYPPNSINNAFEQTIDGGLTFITQYSAIIIVTIIISNIFFISQIKSVEKYEEYILKDDEESLAYLEKIKKKCFSLPNKIYLVHAMVPCLALTIILLVTGAKLSLTLRLVALIITFALVLGLIAYILSNNIFREILIELKNEKKYNSKWSLNYRGRMFILVVPLFLLIVLFMIITTDMLLAKERGDFISSNYSTQFAMQDYSNVDSVEAIKEKLNLIEKFSENDTKFIITRNGVIYSDNDEEITDFFIKYTFNVAENGHTYGYYASWVQGYYEICNIDGIVYACGVMYSTTSTDSNLFIINTGIILFVICLLFLLYFTKDMSERIVVVSENLAQISNQEILDYTEKIPVLSNDETGDLAMSFNKILDIEKHNQEMLIEKERLSSLGQLIGGMAHNLKTPIMSISGASRAIENLINEYQESVGNDLVTIDDHHEIAKEMNEWNEKIKMYLEYMTEVINTTKGQAVSMNASSVNEFTLEELVARVQILMKQQLMHRGCNLNLTIKAEKNTTIKGEISALVQVIDNLIINAMDAYGKNSGNIDFRINENESKVFMEVEDWAGGVSDTVKDKLFKQMITTKGKDGTGLGLYMCYSTIKGKFNGEMRFETKERSWYNIFHRT